MPRLTPYPGEDPKRAAARIRRNVDEETRRHPARPRLDYDDRDEDIRVAYERPMGTSGFRLRIGGAHLLGLPTDFSLADREDAPIRRVLKKKRKRT